METRRRLPLRLEEELPAEKIPYIAIIKKNTNRLINIVEDLLSLSSLESKETRLELEPISIRPLIENIIPMFEPRLKEKGLFLSLSFSDNAVIKGDPFKLEQAFINLIDNAIKYSEQGGITITTAVRNKKVLIEIRDTGVGVSAEHLPRIFERFYVVDKSRSKKMGGTGLGLSIVKHIILLHNGDIEIASEPGKGTVFSILIPVFNG